MSSRHAGYKSRETSYVNETAFYCLRCGSFIVLRSLRRVDATFCLGSAAPTAGARVLVRRRPAGAGHAADRHETRCDQRMRRQVCQFIDRLDLVARGIGERIEFQPDTVLLDDGNVGADATLKTLASVDPGRERLQRARQRLDFADAAAGIG